MREIVPHKTVIEELEESGIEENRIAYLDLDARGNRKITTPDQLDTLIEQSIDLGLPGTKYLFIDEVQNVSGFEKVINGYQEEGDISIFITGSNSYLLSGELATKLTGRYIEIEMFTLSFAEYLEMKKFLGRTLSPSPKNLTSTSRMAVSRRPLSSPMRKLKLTTSRALSRRYSTRTYESTARYAIRKRSTAC